MGTLTSEYSFNEVHFATTLTTYTKNSDSNLSQRMVAWLTFDGVLFGDVLINTLVIPWS